MPTTIEPPAIIWQNEIVCYAFPTRTTTGGLSINDPFSVALSLVSIQILLIFVISNSLNFFLRRLGIPSFVGQALTGVILGPTLLGRTEFFRNELFPHSSQKILEIVGFIGYATFMFLVGVKMDVSTVMNSGKKVMTIGIAAMILPLVFGLAAQQSKIRSAESKYVVSQIFGVTGTQSLTAFAVVSQLLSELKLTNSEIGRFALSAALVTGSCGSFLQLCSAALASDLVIEKRLFHVVGITLLIIIAWFAIRPAMVSLVIKRTPAGERVNPIWIIMILAMATTYQILFDVFRQPFIIGPFVFGLLAIPQGPPLGSSLVEALESVPQHVFFPVFVTMTVMKADMAFVFTDFDNKAYFVALIYWTALLKFVICLFLALPWMPALDSVVLSLIMNSKGVVDISSHAYMRDVRKLPVEIYSLFIFAIIVNATVIPILLAVLYEPSRRYASYHSRNIFALKPFTELRILTCIHKPHHVVSVTKLLDTLCRTEESAVALYVIHLLEQVGHATPIFISHQKQKKSSSAVLDDSSASASVDIMFAFGQYERRNIGFTSLQSFTSISQYKLMQEDIFTLALDKLVSLILIPFHRQWSIDGGIDSENNVLRALNRRILDTAPCSVGILYDRGNSKPQDTSSVAVAEAEYMDAFSEASSLAPSTRSVCMIYLGGRDDHEAISLAKRMANDPCVHLTIMHVLSEESQASEVEGSVVLKGVLQETAENLNVHYMEKVVSDGTDTARVVSSIAGQYDLFVVGRRSDIDMESRQTAGLANWSEFPELGAIGDLLASKDIHTRGSVLVVQQQKKVK